LAETDFANGFPSPATLIACWEIPDLLAKITGNLVILKDGVTVCEETPAGLAACLLAGRNIGCLPVLRGAERVAIVNQNDLFRAFMELLGGHRQGVRIRANTPWEKATAARITGAIVGLGILEIQDARGAQREITLRPMRYPGEGWKSSCAPSPVPSRASARAAAQTGRPRRRGRSSGSRTPRE
jgi:acetoin utilization protein AcuB